MTIASKAARVPEKDEPASCRISHEEDRRHHVLHVAADLFIRHGFAATTTGAIAVQAGMSKKTLYRLFPSKLDLFEEVFREAFTRLDVPPGIGTGSASQIDRLTALLLYLAEQFLDERRISLVRLVLVDGKYKDEVVDVFTRIAEEDKEDALVHWVDAEIGAGRLPDQSRFELAKLIFEHTLSAPLLNALLHLKRPGPDTPQFRAALRRDTAMVLNGIASPDIDTIPGEPDRAPPRTERRRRA